MLRLLVLSSVGLRIMPLLSSGCRATVESLSSAHSSSTVAEQLIYLARCQLHPSAGYYPVQNWQMDA